MRRSFLLTVSSLGLLISLLGSTGLFAALTDSAFTGENQVDSAPLDGSADLQLATAAFVGLDLECGTFDDDLATGLIMATDLPELMQVQSYFCIRNVGSQPVDLTAGAIDLVQADPACTGDEADLGDASCGDPGDDGELAAVLNLLWQTSPTCDNSGWVPVSPGASGTLADHVAGPVDLASLASGQSRCLQLGATIAHETATLVQVAQSDSATWRFRFTGTATP